MAAAQIDKRQLFTQAWQVARATVAAFANLRAAFIAALKKGWSMLKTRTADQIRRELVDARRAARAHDIRLNEGGEGYNPHAQRIAQLEAELGPVAEAELQAQHAARMAAEDAEWTAEVTQQRRADWNAWVRSQGKSIHPATMAAHCKAIGYDMSTLRRHIQRHGL